MVASIDDAEVSRVSAAMGSLPGAEGAPETLNLAWIRLSKIDGVGVDRHGLRANRVPRQWLVSCEDRDSPGAIVSSAASNLTGAKVGSTVEFIGRAGPLRANIVAVRSVDPMQELWHSFLLDCRTLQGQGIFHDLAIRVKPDQLTAAARDLRERFLAIGVISADDVASVASDLTRQVERLVRLLAWYTLAAGVSVLLAILVASRAARREEIATLCALGATRRWIAKAYVAEFAAVGLLAGLVGALLTTGFESLLLSVIFLRPAFALRPFVLVSTAMISSIAAAVAGWIPVYPLLKHTPMEMLRRLKAT